ncbi:hypothetical protein GXW82_19480 [Streptacidiphilus sp. 4-A2]|nr:hypothetical protein [Streptacidiphilus sp. 4-A2]
MVRPPYTFLDQPDGLDEEEDELLMPGPQGSWSEPAQREPVVPVQAVPVQPVIPVQPFVEAAAPLLVPGQMGPGQPGSGQGCPVRPVRSRRCPGRPSR